MGDTDKIAISSKYYLPFINSDHRYYFSPVTLTKLLSRANLIVREFYFCDYGIYRAGGIKGLLSKHFPASRDSLVAICDLIP